MDKESNSKEIRTDLSVKIGKITLKNPVITASGTFGYGNDIHPVEKIAELGAFCTKGLSLKPKKGNPPPRIWETPSGMLNAIGLENMGIEAFLKDVLPDLKKNGVTVFLNIFGESEEEFKEISRTIRGLEGITAVEVNISCPNVKKGGAIFGRDPAMAGRITEIVASNSNFPVIVKLTPEATNIIEVAKSCIQSGAIAVTSVNTFRGMAINPENGRPRLSTIIGGLSGPAIKPISLRIVFELYRETGIPIIASGGIMTGNDAIEYLMAGAVAVEIGTANLLDPLSAFKILDEIEEYCKTHSTKPSLITGMTHKLLKT